MDFYEKVKRDYEAHQKQYESDIKPLTRTDRVALDKATKIVKDRKVEKKEFKGWNKTQLNFIDYCYSVRFVNAGESKLGDELLRCEAHGGDRFVSFCKECDKELENMSN